MGVAVTEGGCERERVREPVADAVGTEGVNDDVGRRVGVCVPVRVGTNEAVWLTVRVVAVGEGEGVGVPDTDAEGAKVALGERDRERDGLPLRLASLEGDLEWEGEREGVAEERVGLKDGEGTRLRLGVRVRVVVGLGEARRVADALGVAGAVAVEGVAVRVGLPGLRVRVPLGVRLRDTDAVSGRDIVVSVPVAERRVAVAEEVSDREAVREALAEAVGECVGGVAVLVDSVMLQLSVFGAEAVCDRVTVEGVSEKGEGVGVSLSVPVRDSEEMDGDRDAVGDRVSVQRELTLELRDPELVMVELELALVVGECGLGVSLVALWDGLLVGVGVRATVTLRERVRVGVIDCVAESASEALTVAVGEGERGAVPVGLKVRVPEAPGVCVAVWEWEGAVGVWDSVALSGGSVPVDAVRVSLGGLRVAVGLRAGLQVQDAEAVRRRERERVAVQEREPGDWVAE